MIVRPVSNKCLKAMSSQIAGGSRAILVFAPVKDGLADGNRDLVSDIDAVD